MRLTRYFLPVAKETPPGARIVRPKSMLRSGQICLGAVKSYRDPPRTRYHIQWKFRDEVRPRFGIMRGREFLMKDAYSFDLDEAGMKASYEAMFVAYLRTFARLGLQAVPVRAP